MSHYRTSFFIIVYLAGATAAGFLGLLKSPLARLTYPWDNFAMFASYSNRHNEIIARGTRNNGDTVMLPMQEIFPMPSVLIERGGGIGVSAIIGGLQGIGREHATTRLCAYLLRRYDQSVSDPSLKLRNVEIKFLSWPLAEGNRMATEELLARCP